MPAFFTAHSVRHALASVALALGLLIVSAAAAGAQQTMDHADSLARLRAASVASEQHVDTSCLVRISLGHDMTPYAIWQCASASAVGYNAAPTACAAAAKWLAAPGHNGFMGLDYVTCEPTTGRVPYRAATDAEQRQLTMDRADYLMWRSLMR